MLLVGSVGVQCSPDTRHLLSLHFGFLFAGQFLELNSQFELTLSAPPPSLYQEFISSPGFLLTPEVSCLGSSKLRWGACSQHLEELGFTQR